MSRIYDATRRASPNFGASQNEQSSANLAEVIASYPEERRPDPVAAPPARVPAAPTAVPPRRRSTPTPAAPAAPKPSARAAEANPRSSDKLISVDTWTPSFAEYRRLAAGLIQDYAGNGTLTLAVTSAIPGEGKTLTAANLALTLANSYARRVLLVDADMRHPILHQLFGVRNATGLGVCLVAGRLLPEASIAVDQGLTLLPAGQPAADPVSYLSSSKLLEFVRDVAGRFDCVIFDTPPAVLLPDAELLAAVVQTTLLVVHSGSTSYKKVERAVEAIGRERIGGVILNQVDPKLVTTDDYGDAYRYAQPM